MKEGYKMTELGLIPNDWKVSKLRDICTGKGTYGINAAAVSYDKNLPTYLRITDIDVDGTFISNKKKSVNHQDSDNFYLNVGDIVFARTGNTTGKSYLYNKADGKLVYAGFLIKFSPDKELYSVNFLKHFTETKIYWDWVKVMSTRSGQPGINEKQYSGLSLPFPPLKEQKKIAKILSTVDNKIAVLDEQLLETQALKKGLMQRLLTKGIGHTEFKESVLGEIPVGWEVSSFRNFTKVNQGLQIPISKRLKSFIPDSYRYITIQFLKNPNDESNIYYVSNPMKSVICSKDEILMTRTGNTGIVVTNVEGVFHNNFFKVDFNRKEFLKDFLFFYLNSAPIQNYIKLYAGGTTIPDLNHGDFYRIPLIKPSLKEQQKIAKILTTVDDKLQVLKDKKTEYQSLKKGLMQQLLTGKIRVKIDN